MRPEDQLSLPLNHSYQRGIYNGSVLSDKWAEFIVDVDVKQLQKIMAAAQGKVKAAQASPNQLQMHHSTDTHPIDSKSRSQHR